MKSHESTAATRRPRALGKRLLAAAVVLSVALALGAACGCQPQNSAASSPTTPMAQTDEDAPSSSFAIEGFTDSDFQNISTGLMPDNYQNQLQNYGNRGCNACHEDLYDVISQTQPRHMVASAGYKNMTYADCQPCHDFRWGKAGSYFGDSLHGSHYGSSLFTDDMNGNCWSCHATITDVDNNVTWELWDEVKYDVDFNGFCEENAFADAGITWVQTRGISTSGLLNGASIDSKPSMTVTFDQPVSEEEDAMVIHNYYDIELPGLSWAVDQSYDDWTLDVTGVKNPRSFTMDDLKAMEQTSYTVTQNCVTTGLGCTTVYNVPVSGVRIADIIEACGGIEGDVSEYQLYPTAADTWTGEGTNGMALSCYLDTNSIIALTYWGHELTADNGNPASIVMPGYPGSCWVKHITNLDLVRKTNPDEVMDPYTGTMKYPGIYAVNSGFFQEDGVSFPLSDGVKLTGYAFSWNPIQGGITNMSFSTDYGQTWTDFTPEGLDPCQWTCFNLDWQPPEPGTYVIKVRATAEDGSVQRADASLIVTVTE